MSKANLREHYNNAKEAFKSNDLSKAMDQLLSFILHCPQDVTHPTVKSAQTMLLHIYAETLNQSIPEPKTVQYYGYKIQEESPGNLLFTEAKALAENIGKRFDLWVIDYKLCYRVVYTNESGHKRIDNSEPFSGADETAILGFLDQIDSVE